MKNHSVTVGDVDITKAVSDFSFTERLNDMAVGTIRLKARELFKFPPLNYAAEIRISKLLDTGSKTLFRGNITSVVVKSDGIIVSIAAGIDLFQETVIQGMAVADIGHLELVWSIVRGAGLGEERINIEGFKKGPIEPFELIVPISGIELSTDTSFSEFELTSDPKIADIAKTTSKDKSTELIEEFTQAGLWLRVIVRATTIYDAEIEGLSKIDVLLSRLTSRIQLSVSRLGHHSEWERNRLFSKPVRGDLVLVRGLTTRRRWLRRPFGDNIPAIDVAKLPDIDFPPLAYELPLYLTEAFLAWQRSIHANHPLAAITSLWDAIEFYSSQIKVSGDFTKVETRQIRKDAVQSLDKSDEIKRARVTDVLGMLNQASLSMKFDLAMKEDEVVLSDEETRVLKKLRETRNNFVHGKEVTLPSDSEMLLARTTVNRILMARVLRLTRSAKA